MTHALRAWPDACFSLSSADLQGCGVNCSPAGMKTTPEMPAADQSVAF
jgi:hypothetical protein